jgi:hypothetical protein
MSFILLLPKEFAIGVWCDWLDIFELSLLDSAMCNITGRLHLLNHFKHNNFTLKNFDSMSLPGLLSWIQTRSLKLHVLHITKDFRSQDQKFLNGMDRSMLTTLAIIDETASSGFGR